MSAKSRTNRAAARVAAAAPSLLSQQAMLSQGHIGSLVSAETAALANIKSNIIMVSPELASQILTRNTRNRPLRESRVQSYAKEMVEGRWKMNGEAIQISDKNNLMNGQHRLHAVIVSGKTVPMLIVEGVDEATFSTMDGGMNRTAGDVLGMRGVSNPTQVAAIIRMTLNYRDGVAMTTPRSNKEIEDTITRIPSLEQYVSDYLPLIRMSRSSVVAAVCFIAEHFGDVDQVKKVQEFVEGVALGVNLGADDPRLIFRNKLISLYADRGRRPEQIVIWYYAQRALNHYLKGSRIGKLQAERNGKQNFSEIPSAPRATVKTNW